LVSRKDIRSVSRVNLARDTTMSFDNILTSIVDGKVWKRIEKQFAPKFSQF